LEEGWKRPAIFVDRVQIALVGSSVRFIFAEQGPGCSPICRAAIAMSLNSAIEIAKALTDTIVKGETDG
jgi:hypothetical protein